MKIDKLDKIHDLIPQDFWSRKTDDTWEITKALCEQSHNKMNFNWENLGACFCFVMLARKSFLEAAK